MICHSPNPPTKTRSYNCLNRWATRISTRRRWGGRTFPIRLWMVFCVTRWFASIAACRWRRLVRHSPKSAILRAAVSWRRTASLRDICRTAWRSTIPWVARPARHSSVFWISRSRKTTISRWSINIPTSKTATTAVPISSCLSTVCRSF